MNTETVSKIVEFNNAGVDAMYLREPGVAWHLFKGAAELKIVAQQNESMPFRMLLRANSFVSIAESLILQNSRLEEESSLKDSCEEAHSCSAAPEPEQPRGNRDTSSALQHDQRDEPMHQDGTIFMPTTPPSPEALKPSCELNSILCYRAGVIGKSFKLAATCTEDLAMISGALLVYNLAVVEHLFNATNGQPVLLYHLAASLLDPAKTEDQNLYSIILNNTGVLYLENNSIEAAQSTMRHLRTQLDQYGDITDDCESSYMMRRNIQYILSPPRSMISPAA